jgi:TolA-binding protein
MVRTARTAVAATAAFLVTISASAQQYGSPEDVATFSSALLHNRYPDLGKDVIKTALDRGIQDSGGVLAFALCEISANEALQTADAAQKVPKLKEAITAYEDYLKKFPTSDRAAVARVMLAEWLRTAGEAVATQLKKETAPEKKEALKNDGLNLLTKAEVQSKARIDDIQKIPKDKMSEQNQNEMLVLKFAVARMPFSKALLYENRTGVEAQSLLNDAQTLLEEFDLDAPPGHPLVFEARRMLALIAIERGDEANMKLAEETLTFSCDQLAEAVAAAKEQGDDIVKDVPANQEVRELIARMFLEKAEFLTKTKKPRDWKGALDTTEQLLKVIPDVVKTKDGKQALMIMVEALAEENQTPRARTIAQQIYDNDPAGDAGLRAREWLDKFGQGGGSDPASMLKLLAGTVERRDVVQGERAAARILGNASPEMKAIRADALLQLGGLYFQSGLYAYAGVTFAAVADEFPNSPRAPEAKFNEAMSYARQAQLDARDKPAANFWKDKSKAARDGLTTRFPNSKEALDVAWFAAQDKELEEKFPEAVDLYFKVPASSPRYAEAQYKAGALAFDLGLAARLREKPDEVVKRFKETETGMKGAIAGFDATAKSAINPQEIAALKEQSFAARLRLAGLYIQKEHRKPEEGLKLLDEVEAANKDDKAKMARIWSLRIKTLSQLGRGREAIDVLKANKDLANAETFVMVAANVDADAMDKLKADEKDESIKEDLKVAAEFYSMAVDKAGGAGQKVDWGRVGQRLLFIGARLSGLSDDMQLTTIDPTVPIAEKSTIEHAKKALEMAAPAGDLDIDRQRAIAFAAAATGNWLDAVTALREITNKLVLFTPQHKLNKDALAQYSRLPDVYQDLAVAHIRGAKRGEKALFDTAKEILVKLIINSETGSKRYWEVRYLHLLALEAAEEFGELSSTLDGLARTAPDADGNKYGIKAKIDEIRARNSKVINK